MFTYCQYNVHFHSTNYINTTGESCHTQPFSDKNTVFILSFSPSHSYFNAVKIPSTLPAWCLTLKTSQWFKVQTPSPKQYLFLSQKYAHLSCPGAKNCNHLSCLQKTCKTTFKVSVYWKKYVWFQTVQGLNFSEGLWVLRVFIITLNLKFIMGEIPIYSNLYIHTFIYVHPLLLAYTDKPVVILT